jgi:GT2 family glycosyltransferase
MNVSVIIPTHNPDLEMLKKIENIVKSQNFKGKIEIIKVKNKGLSESLNYGIKKAKTKVIISLHQDCLPENKNWLNGLVSPLSKKKIVASVSDVELPHSFWKKFGLLARIMSAKEQKIITPLLDEKGCAYKKSAIVKVGFFDDKNFKTAGEDFDMWIKLKKIGEIAYPKCKVYHYHKHTFKDRIKKEIQLSNGFGALVKIYGTNMPNYKIGLIKSAPFLGWPLFWIKFPYSKIGISSILWFPLSLIVNLIYSFGFWKGYLIGKQTI